MIDGLGAVGAVSIVSFCFPREYTGGIGLTGELTAD